MCDLDAQETGFVVGAIDEVSRLAEQLAAQAETITASQYMPHEELAALLNEISEKALAAREWVVAKPLAHAAHHEHGSQG